MNRFVSFGLLLAVIIVTGFVFFKVMAGFFVPLFLAALLVVLFRPLHEWILKRIGQRPKIGAALTTATILLIVLLPFSIAIFFAGFETRTVIRQLDPMSIDDNLRQTRANLDLEMPVPGAFERIEDVIESIQQQSVAHNLVERRKQIQYDITELRSLSIDLQESLIEEGYELEWIEAEDDEAGDTTAATQPVQHAWSEYSRQLTQSRHLLADENWETLDDVDQQQQQLTQAREQFTSSIEAFYDFKTKLLGGQFRAWLTEIVNPNPGELSNYIQQATTWLRSRLLSFGGATTAFVVKFIFGVVIMTFALFSFLLDGPAMLWALKQLSPLDEQYENELVAEFDRVCRAVVLATLLSALAQGILAGIGFYFAGVDSVFLLMLLTSVLALVPFVGAAAVWIPVCLWLLFVDGRIAAGVFLAVYGVGIISMADNVIKPFVLHGQSNLHPLWALLSVLGGVSALGPIGILIGPMVVVFLQTLLKILQREITEIDNGESGEAASTTSEH